MVTISAQITDYKKAPNSYIYNIEAAQKNNLGGLYIPVNKAYAMWSDYEYLKDNGVATPIPSGLQSASVIWEDVPGLISGTEIISNADPSNSKIKIKVNSAKGKGNAVVALKVDDTVYWSWHIWVTDNPENGVTYSQGFETDADMMAFEVKYMDRNLGAVSNTFIGENWDKSGGLMYEWGRKDPFPPLVYKDSFFYEITGEAGTLRHKSADPINTIPVKVREFAEIEKNIQFSVKNPITYIINTDNTGNWFSSNRYKVAGTDTTNYVSWDLWSDNAEGGNSNANSSNTTLKNESRSYELKSELDPCPNGWRVPSYYGRVTPNNNLSPFGRKANWNNDDTTNYAKLQPTVKNRVLDGIKVYPGRGMDFTAAQNGERNMGVFPISGTYVYYPNAVAPNAPVGVIYQDQNANGGLWSSTFGYDGARLFMMVSDATRTNTSVGLHEIYINQTNPTKAGNAVRCMKDPNLMKIGNFETEYFVNEKESFRIGLDQPNSYLANSNLEVRIPVSKAFAVYNQILSDGDMLPSDNLVAKVYWATNPNLITSVNLAINDSDARLSEIIVKTNNNQTGNAVISLHNGSTKNPAYWSWHIWAPATNPIAAPVIYKTEASISTQYNFIDPTLSQLPPITSEFMDRNLGALEKMPSTADAPKAVKSRGLHFQWGRKDPIPVFAKDQNGIEEKIYLGSEEASRTDFITYTEISKLNYEASETIPYSNYGSLNPVEHLKMRENIKFSVENPSKFLYHQGLGAVYDGGNKNNNNLSLIKDWATDGRSKGSERWGHAGRKSVFDPCPLGWRVPDVSYTNLYKSSKGNSPWYNGYLNDAYGKPGVIQDQWHSVATYYEGTDVGGYGWAFEGANYKIGNFAKDGIRGEIGENKVNDLKSGVWTASMADLGTGYALAMQFEGSRMQTGTGVYPQAAMGVRCVKDNFLPLMGGSDGTQPIDTNDGSLGANETKSIGNKIYPNPFNQEIRIKLDDVKRFNIFDISGKMVKTGEVINQTINTESLSKGVYIIKVELKNGTTTVKKMIKL